MKKNDYFDRHEPISLKEWIVTYLFLCIPIVGLILLFVWSFSKQVKISKQTWAQCVLCFFGFFGILFVILGLSYGWDILLF